MDIPRLDAEVQEYCRLGLAPSTTKVYETAAKRFSAFCRDFNITQPFPVTELLLCRFVAEMARAGLAPATMRTYLAGVRHAQIMRGFPEPSQSGSFPRLKLVQAGVARARLTRPMPTPRQRLPITLDILSGLLDTWSRPTEGMHAHDRALLKAAVTVCFFGFFRSGEITVPSVTGFNERIHLAWGDVATDNRTPPSILRVHLKKSKCDQLGKGVDVYMGRTGARVCPVTETLTYVELRGSMPGPFFRFRDGTPLTKAAFVTRVRLALGSLGLEAREYAGHSFRIGAATAAAEAGLEDSVIQSLGRWSSSAFLQYIRTPRERLACYSRSLTVGRPRS